MERTNLGFEQVAIHMDALASGVSGEQGGHDCTMGIETSCNVGGGYADFAGGTM